MHLMPHSLVTSKYVALSGNENERKLKRHSGRFIFLIASYKGDVKSW